MAEKPVRNDIDTPNKIVSFPILKGEEFVAKVSNISIEISGRCNAKCPYCARQRFEQRYAGKNMSPILFEQILDHLIEIGLIHREHGRIIYLYNWGEPFLNPKINEILKILQKNNQSGGVSSNFIKIPKIDRDTLQILSEVKFSLSGFSQDSYSKIHGASLKTVLSHFEDFYELIRNYSPNTKIIIAWHRYKFNEQELFEAFQYFHRPGIHFSPSIAYLNDLHEMLDYAKGELSENRKKQAEKDLFLDHISEGLAYHKKRSKNYLCFMWNYLVVDETGQLLLCCGMSNKDHNHILGNVLKMSSEEIWQKKLSDSICSNCILSGVPRALGPIGHKNIPNVRLRNSIELWYHINLTNGYLDYMYAQLGKMIRDFPWGGEKYFRKIRNIKEKY